MYTFTIAVCDTNPGQMKLLRSLCTGVAIRANLEIQPSNGSFCRVHQSWLVNLNNVVCLDLTQHLLYMQNEESVPISKAYYEKAVNTLETYFEQGGSGLCRDI